MGKFLRSARRLAAVSAMLLATLAIAVVPATAAPAEVTVDVDCDNGLIVITSTKDISNIVYSVDGEHTKLDELTGTSYELPLDSISTLWVKSGNNQSGDGPGYGERFDIPSDVCAVDTTLGIEKDGPPAVFSDQQFEFSIEVTNTGTEPASNVIVTDTLPVEGSFVSSTPGGTLASGVLTIPLGTIAPGDTSVISVLWQAPPVETTLSNTAAAVADNAPLVSDGHTVDVGIKTIVTGGVTAAGTGLRNRDNGNITITDVPADATVTRAVLTWAVLYTDPVPGNQITFEGDLITADLTQTISNHLCWGDSNTIGYAADVTHLVSGNGVYAVTDPINGIVREDGEPFGILPYTDGATLVVFYGGDGYDDQVLSDFTYSAENSGDNVRNLTGITSIGGAATLYLAGPDGQGNGGERVLITGAGTLNFDNSWDGSDPQEGPDFAIGNLWDTDVHDVSSIVPAGQTTLDINLGLGGDCTGLSAVALQIEQ